MTVVQLMRGQSRRESVVLGRGVPSAEGAATDYAIHKLPVIVSTVHHHWEPQCYAFLT